MPNRHQEHSRRTSKHPKGIDLRDRPPPDLEAMEPDEGEGNRTADRNYRKGVAKHLQTHDVEAEARQAANALEDRPPRADLDMSED